MNRSLKPSLTEIGCTFLKLGITAFGGPAAHISMMEIELVKRKEWLQHDDFLDLISAANLIPGPNSTEVAIHVGYKMSGWRGLVIAGISFIVPAFLIVWVLAWFYVHFGSIPTINALFLGVTPVILAIIAQAIWSLSQKAVKDKILGILAGFSLALFVWGYNEILILSVIALTNLILRLNIRRQMHYSILCLLTSICIFKWNHVFAHIESKVRVPIENLFMYFVKVGSVLFGSGYVLIAFLQRDLVEHYGWINEQQLLDAIAIGQLTPGPVFTTATFIGYLTSGHSGAIAATLGIFAPAFFFVAISAPFISKLRQSKWTAYLLDGLNVASLSLMLGAGIFLGKGIFSSYYGVVIFSLSYLLLMKFKINSMWLILASGTLGMFGFANF